jgi:hypothetical protein
VQAINAGVWGMTNIDEYHLLEDKLLSLQPDIVVIGLFMANDINTNLGHREQVANATSWFDELRTRSALVHVCSLQAMVCNARGRWTAAASRVGYHGARRRPRGFGSSGSRRGRVAHGASCPRTVERAAFVFGRGRGSELRGHGSAAARGAVRVDLDTTRGG